MASDIDFPHFHQDNLVSGHSPWGRTALGPESAPLEESLSADVAIVGAGITGALAAEHLTAQGLSVVIIDTDKPGLGSTAASTAMLQWEIDTQLSELSLYYGFSRAASIYRRSAIAVSGLSRLITRLDIPCRLRPRSTLYLANNASGARELQQELQLRKRAGLPGDYLAHPHLMTEFDMEREGGIHSTGSAEADPLALTWGLLEIAMQRGARLFTAKAEKIESDSRRVYVQTDTGHGIEAGHVVLATGYAMPGIEMPKLHRTTSSWAFATVPQDPSKLWRERALIWEESHPYLYMRTTHDNRIIVGGEDDETIDPERREAKSPDKIATLRGKLKRLWPQADTRVGYSWSGTFGETVDGLPLIGPLPGMPRVFGAYGYGGNGITFSFMAALMIGAMVKGETRDWFEDFAIDRPDPGFRTSGMESSNRMESVLRH